MLKLIVAATLAAAAAMPAGAAILNYRLFGGSGPADTGFYRFSFRLDTDRSPSFFTSDTARFAPTPVSYSLPGSATVIQGTNSNLGPSFFTAINQGGLSILRLPQGPDLQPRFFGPALFDGPTTDPNFFTGNFRLSTMPRNVPGDVQVFDYRLIVTASVPEPATWALMIGGFGLVGAAMRRRMTVPA